MDRNSNSYVITFAVSVCVILAIGLAATYNGLSDRIASNELFDQQKNILSAVGLYDKANDAKKSRAELEHLLAKYVRGEVLEVERAPVTERVREAGVESDVQVVRVVDVRRTDHAVEELRALRRAEAKKRDPAQRRELVPFYRRVDDAGNDVAYCIPISGYGLWSTLYGFLALDADLDHVRGITFYKHAETPGLGGEVDNPGWQAQWRGKRIRDEAGRLVSVAVKKGKVDPTVEGEKLHMVDGLSGATITSNGVTRFVERDLRTYEKYFQKLKAR